MSHTKVEIKITEGCDEAGNGGETTAYPIAIMPQQVWDDTMDAWADARGWTELIDNPSYDPDQPTSEQNPEKIPNPITKAWNVTVGWRERSALLIKNLKKRLGIAQTEQAVNDGINMADGSITVTEGQ